MATTENKPAPTAKQVAQNAQEPTPAVQASGAAVPDGVMALHRINGTIEPQTPFRPASEQDRADLVALGAVRELTDAERALFERLEANTSDVLG